jgi:prepilin-type N-terminal cleavage/methylation domain-containing protein
MRISRARTSARIKGFTLLELLIVILLVSIFLTFASVNWDATAKKGKEAFLEKVSIRIALLREEAVSDFENKLIQFDVTEGKIRIGKRDEEGVFVETGGIELPDDLTIKDVAINGEPFSTGKGYMTFYPAGMVDRVVLHLNAGEDFYSLLINPLTARVTGENGYIEETPLKNWNNPS